MSAAAFAFWTRPGSFRRHNSSRERGGAESYNGAESGRGGGQVRFFPLIRESPGFRGRERENAFLLLRLSPPPTEVYPFPFGVCMRERGGKTPRATHTLDILSAAGLKVLKGGKARCVCVGKKFFLGGGRAFRGHHHQRRSCLCVREAVSEWGSFFISTPHPRFRIRPTTHRFPSISE